MKYFIESWNGDYLNLSKAKSIYVNEDYNVIVKFGRDEEYILETDFEDIKTAQKYLDDLMNKLYYR